MTTLQVKCECLSEKEELVAEDELPTLTLHTAEYYQNHFLAGLTMCDKNQDGDIEWIGSDKNWIMLGWLNDGVYSDMTREEKGKIISEYLSK